MRGRWAVMAVSLAMAGCVAPAALSGGPAASPAASSPAATALAPATAGARPVGGDAAAAEDSRQAAVAAADAALARSGTAPSASVPPDGAAEWRDGQGLPGVDVSRYQETVDWQGLAQSGHAFVFVKATEGSSHRSPTHDDQRADARAAGLVQGAYHYARPGQSSGTLQARFFHSGGGSWTADGLTLPGALDLEFAEDGPQCHGLDQAEMRSWLREFSDEYRRLSGRIPVIYTKAQVWDTCTGGDASFSDHPLWLYDHGDVPGVLPAGWESPTFWQRGVVDHLDRNVYFGTRDQLASWASAPLR